MQIIRTLPIILMSMIIATDLSAQEKVMSDSAKSVLPKIQPPLYNSTYLKVAPIQNNYYNQLGAACKMELNFEKSTKVPLRLRLGSLQQTDYMEQKPNAIKPGK
jgi:hypothetical protein